MLRNNKYHPMTLTQDLVRKDMFDIVIQRDTDDYIFLKYCKSFDIQFPQSNVVNVNWMGGVMQLAGRVSNGYQLQTTFLVNSSEMNRDALTALYNWRNDAFGHSSGTIYEARNYKCAGHIDIYNVSGDKLLYRYVTEGLWATQISNISLAVDDDTPIEVTATFAADKVYLENNASIKNK